MPAPVGSRRPGKGSPLRGIAYHKHRELASYLDIAERWRRLIEVMPVEAYSTVEVEKMAMAIHRPGGSPASELLSDLGIRGYTVEQLVSFLRKLKYESPLLLLLPKDPVSILTHPENVVCSVGDEIVLEVKASGLPFPNYQWYNSEKQKIPDACHSVLRIPNACMRDQGSYIVNVSNDVNHAFSNWAEVTIIGRHTEAPEPLMITRQPPPVVKEYEGEIVKIHCYARGPRPLEYQWFIDDKTALSLKSLNSVLIISGAKVEDSGRYRCKVTSRALMGEALHSQYCQLIIERRGRGYRQPDPIATEPIDPTLEPKGPTAQPQPHQWQEFPQDGVVAGATAVAAPCHMGARAFQPMVSSVDHSGAGAGGAVAAYFTPVPDSAPPASQKLKGKVALVIGNQRYYGNMDPLFQTESDAAEIASLLTSIDNDFRVVSLINLTAHEMKAAIAYFISLLGPGIYGVFYFAGHGFEVNGESYLLPVDAGVSQEPDQCVRAEDILFRMQTRGAKFSFLMLDVCRTEKPITIELVKNNPKAKRASVGNYIVAHSCIPDKMAYERRSEENGIYMSHVKKFLRDDKKLEDVLGAVAKSIANSYPDSVQRAEYKSSTTEDIRLHEKISYTSVGEHKEYAKLLDAWQQAHQEPSVENPLFSYHGLTIMVTFQAEFSNVLIICLHTNIEDKQAIEHLSIDVEMAGAFSSDIMIEELRKKAGSKEAVKQVTNLHVRPKVTAPYCYRICDIQKLRGTLSLNFKIRYNYMRAECQKNITRDFPAPLVASLNLLKQSPVESPQ